jgi:hypothetical protein
MYNLERSLVAFTARDFDGLNTGELHEKDAVVTMK